MKFKSPFINRQDEWDVINPLIGKSMLELGNKKNGLVTYKSFFNHLGMAHTSVDLNGENGALKLDLRQPLGLGQFDMITNIGTSEHVDQQEPVWRNMVEAMHLGSILVSITPVLRDWPGHGIYYPLLEFYAELSIANRIRVDKMYMACNADGRRLIYFRGRRQQTVPFAMPDPRWMERG